MSKPALNRKLKPVANGKTDGAKTNYTEMKTSEIRDLIDFISQSGLNEVNIETKELKLHVKREPDQKVLKSSSAPMMTMAAPIAQPIAQQQQAAPAKQEKVVAAGKKTADI